MNRNEQQVISANAGINDLAGADDKPTQIRGASKLQSQAAIALKSDALEQDSALGELEPTGEIKGGPGGYSSGGVLINHNETAAEDDEAEADALDDLPAPVNALPDLEPEDEVVGGALKGKPQHLVDSWTQHNETMAEDEDTHMLDDLPVSDEQDEQVKGGRMLNIKNPELTR